MALPNLVFALLIPVVWLVRRLDRASRFFAALVAVVSSVSLVPLMPPCPLTTTGAPKAVHFATELFFGVKPTVVLDATRQELEFLEIPASVFGLKRVLSELSVSELAPVLGSILINRDDERYDLTNNGLHLSTPLHY